MQHTRRIRSAIVLSTLLILFTSFTTPFARARQETEFEITIQQPTPTMLVGNELDVVVTIESTYEVEFVRARGAGREVALEYDGDEWRGTTSLTGIPRGQRSLVVTAVDVLENSAQATSTFLLDRPPVITVEHPYTGTVARPSIRVTATCTDDDPQGCQTLVVRLATNRSVILLRGSASINQVIDLPAGTPTAENVVEIIGRDSAGQGSVVSRSIFVEPSTRLTLAAPSVFGTILDAAPGRLLYVDTTGPHAVVKIRDEATGQTDASAEIPETDVVVRGTLTPYGVIYSTRRANGRPVSYEIRDGQRLPTAFGQYNAAGRYAAFHIAGNLSYPPLKRRDVTTGAEVAVNSATGAFDVAANGDVVWIDPQRRLLRYRTGSTSTLATPELNYYTIDRPVTDGKNVVYYERRGGINLIRLHTSAGIRTLAQHKTYDLVQSERYYRVNNGWVAYSKPGPTGVNQVWTISSAGVERQVTFFSKTSWIDALSPTGDVAFISNNVRYLARVGKAPVAVSGAFGTASRSFFRGSQLDIVIGRSIFKTTN